MINWRPRSSRPLKHVVIKKNLTLRGLQNHASLLYCIYFFHAWVSSYVCECVHRHTHVAARRQPPCQSLLTCSLRQGLSLA